jgi:23S rRNA (uracil1939-C5)-methyltransferase
MPAVSLEFPAGTVAPLCPHFFECGGCDAQDVPYVEQVASKQAWLKLLFGADAPWLPFIASTDEYPRYYRGKIRYGFVEQDGVVSLSRHGKGEKSPDVPVDACYLQSVVSVAVARYTAVFATENGWKPYDPVTGTGWLKHVLVREGKNTGEMLVGLVTGEGSKAVDAWAHGLVERFPSLKSVYHCTSAGRSLEQIDDRILWGDAGIHERIGSKTFYISLHAFFQTNVSMVQALYDAVRERAEALRPAVIWDLYAGSSTIGIYLSSLASEVICVEIAESNIADATNNITLNSIGNVRMVGGAVEDVLTSAFLKTEKSADLIVVDPPRAGMSEGIRNLLPNLKPHTLIYVSCNPITCMRDVRDLARKGYIIASIRGVDMFPHTRHCEMIVELTRK